MYKTQLTTKKQEKKYRERKRERYVNHQMKQISVQKNLSDKEIMLICLR